MSSSVNSIPKPGASFGTTHPDSGIETPDNSVPFLSYWSSAIPGLVCIRYSPNGIFGMA